MNLANVEIEAGDSKVLIVSIEDENGGSIEGATIKYWAGPRPNSPVEDVEIEKTIGSGIEITSAENRVLEITIDPEDTDSLGGRILYHECEVTDALGNVSTVLTGELYIAPTWIGAA